MEGGVLVILISVGSTIGTLLSGIYLRRFGRLRNLLVGSMMVLFATTLLIRLRRRDEESTTEAIFEVLLCGVCDGVAVGALLVGLLDSVNRIGKQVHIAPLTL